MPDIFLDVMAKIGEDPWFIHEIPCVSGISGFDGEAEGTFPDIFHGMDGLFTVKYGSFINVGASWGPRKNGMCTSLGEF